MKSNVKDATKEKTDWEWDNTDLLCLKCRNPRLNWNSVMLLECFVTGRKTTVCPEEQGNESTCKHTMLWQRPQEGCWYKHKSSEIHIGCSKCFCSPLGSLELAFHWLSVMCLAAVFSARTGFLWLFLYNSVLKYYAVINHQKGIDESEL